MRRAGAAIRATELTGRSRGGWNLAMRKFLRVAVLGAATLVLASCGAPSAPDFVHRAAMSDLYEIEAGKIASEKGQSDAVKQYGQHMVEAHTKTSEELKSIVAAEKLDVAPPSRLNKRYQSMIEVLNKAKPEIFDKVYAKQQVKAHKRAAELLDDYAEGGDNAALKQFAANVLPTVKQHLEQAEKLSP
jgi:putative membrane protein